MTEAKLDFPEVVGKLVAELFVVDDPELGKEILVRFSDGTQLSIAMGVRQVLTRGTATKKRQICPCVTGNHFERRVAAAIRGERCGSDLCRDSEPKPVTSWNQEARMATQSTLRNPWKPFAPVTNPGPLP